MLMRLLRITASSILSGCGWCDGPITNKTRKTLLVYKGTYGQLLTINKFLYQIWLDAPGQPHLISIITTFWLGRDSLTRFQQLWLKILNLHIHSGWSAVTFLWWVELTFTRVNQSYILSVCYSKLCWIFQEDIGLVAINDAFMLECSVYKLLDINFQDKKCYPNLVALIHRVSSVLIKRMSEQLLMSEVWKREVQTILSVFHFISFFFCFLPIFYISELKLVTTWYGLYCYHILMYCAVPI